MDIRISEIDGQWWVYAFDSDHYQCLSVTSNKDGSRWFANGESDKAIQYVGKPFSSKKSAQAYARRHS